VNIGTHLEVGEESAFPLTPPDIEADLELFVHLKLVDQRDFVLEELKHDLLRVHFVSANDELALHETARERLGLHHFDEGALHVKLHSAEHALQPRGRSTFRIIIRPPPQNGVRDRQSERQQKRRNQHTCLEKSSDITIHVVQ